MVRNRGTMALSEEGRSTVMGAVHKRGWTQVSWAFRSNVSPSTLKRFLKSERIDPGCFYALLGALNLEVQDGYIQKRAEETDTLPQLSKSFLSVHTQPGVFMTATFESGSRAQIQKGIEHLGQLLVGSKVKYSEDGEGVTVTGGFSESDRKHIEMTINSLEEWFTSLKITW